MRLVALIQSEFPEFGIGVAGYPKASRSPQPRMSIWRNLSQRPRSPAGARPSKPSCFFDNEAS